jgi:hypothetical protein
MNMHISLPRSRSVFIIAAAAAALQLVGCAAVKLPAASGTAANAEKLRAAGAQVMTTGEFKAAPGKAASADSGLSIRGTNSISPTNGSFALQLRDQLAAELKAAGLDSAGAKVVISATVTDNQLETGLSKGMGRLAARFQVQRDGRAAYDKELAASSEWEASFVAAVAVPDSFNRYGALYQTLIGKLIDDPEFRAAVKR